MLTSDSSDVKRPCALVHPPSFLSGKDSTAKIIVNNLVRSDSLVNNYSRKPKTPAVEGRTAAEARKAWKAAADDQRASAEAAGRKRASLVLAVPAGAVIDPWAGSATTAEGRSLGSRGATVRSRGATVRSRGATVPERRTDEVQGEVSIPVVTGRTRVPDRWKLLHTVKKVTRAGLEQGQKGPAVCGCGIPVDDVRQGGDAAPPVNVIIHLRAAVEGGERIRAGVSGVYRCDSGWLCPVCAVAKAKVRAERVLRVSEAAYGRRGCVVSVIFTASHRLSTPLKDVRSLVAGASSRARKGRRWTTLAADRGILGTLVAPEVTVSRTAGWHFHQHLAVIVDGPSDLERSVWNGDADALAAAVAVLAAPVQCVTYGRRLTEARAVAVADYRAELFASRIGDIDDRDAALERAVRCRAEVAGLDLSAVYEAEIVEAGGRISRTHGTRVRVCDDAKDASTYPTKGSAAWEIAGGHKDETKGEHSLTPWDLVRAASKVDDIGGFVDKWAFARWHEYILSIKGLRSCVVTPSLAKKLGVKAADDKERPGAQQHEEVDGVVGRIEASAWRDWLRFGLAAVFLARVERGGAGWFDAAVSETEADADQIESVWERHRHAAAERKRRAAEEQEVRIRAGRAEQAAYRILSQDGAGTRDRVARIHASMATEHPDMPLPTESEIITAMARVA